MGEVAKADVHHHQRKEEREATAMADGGATGDVVWWYGIEQLRQV